MKLTDPRLYQARNLQDFRFRLGFVENSRERNTQEFLGELYKGADLESRLTSVLVMPDQLRTWLTDHSDWDGNVDFAPMRAMGARGTWIKAMEGTVRSRRYVDNTVRAKAEGLAVAPYHWLHQNAKVNAKLQAQEFWKFVQPYAGKLPPMVDFEWTNFAGQPANPSYLDLDIWVTEFTRISGIKPVWYSAGGYVNLWGRMPAALRAKFAGFVVANYGVLVPNMPLGFGLDDWDFWQFAASGNAEVISPNDAGKKEVDLIYSDLIHAVFDNKYGVLNPVPNPEPNGDPMNFELTVLALGLNVRAGAGIENPITAPSLRKDDKVFSNERVADSAGAWWYRVASVFRGGLNVPTTGNGWASSGATGGLMRLDNATAPEPTELPAYFTAHDAAGNALGRYNKE